MALLSYVPGQQIRVNGVPRRLLDWDATSGYVAYASTANATLDIRDGGVDEGDRVEIWAGYGGALAPCFAGEVDDDGVEYWPNRLTIKCSGQLARTQKATGHVDPSAQQPPDTAGGSPTDYAAAYANMTDGQIVVALLALYNITAVSIQDSGQVFGTIQPVRLGVNQAAWQLIQELDEATGYKTFDGPDGVVHRLPTIGVPGVNAGVTLSQGADLIAGTRTRSRRYVNNVVTVSGIANLEGTTGIPFTPTATERGTSPYIRADQVYTWSSTLLETASACDAVAVRKLSELNRLREQTTVALGRLRADIRPAMTASVDAPALGYAASDRFWVMQVQHRSSGRKLATTLTVFHAYAVDGFNPHQPPVAVANVQAEAERLADGTDLTLAFLDGTASYAPMGTIVSYLWSGSPATPVATGPSGATATVRYTGTAPPSATATLTVLDDTGAAGTTTIPVGSIAASGANTRDIWGAITTDLLYSPDGGKTWGSAGIAAVGCCAEADPLYQLAWTVGGDLYKVSLATSGVGTTAMSASATLAGKGITAAWTGYDQDGHFTGRCYAAGTGGRVYLSVDDATTWTAMGAIPALGPGGVTQIAESPFARGDLAATAGNQSWHSFDSGATWASTYAHPTTALEATRLASGFAQHWVGFAGVGVTGEPSRVEEVEQLVALDVTPASAKPIAVTGLALGVYQDRLYLTDIASDGVTGRAWTADAAFSGNFASAVYPNAALGPPRHLTRDGFYPGLLYGAADKALFKSPDEFASILTWKALTAPQVGKMVGFGALRRPGVYGNLIALCSTGTGGIRCAILGSGGWRLATAPPYATIPHNNGVTTPLLRVGSAYFTWNFGTVGGSISVGSATVANALKSTDRGTTWAALSLGGVLSLAAAADGTLYALTGDGTALQRSTDGGATWSTRTLPVTPCSLVVVASGASNTVGVNAAGGFYVSANGGASWSAAITPGDSNFIALGGITDTGAALWAPNATHLDRAAPGAPTGTTVLTTGGFSRPTLRALNGALFFWAAHLYRSTDDGLTWPDWFGATGTTPGGGATIAIADVAYDSAAGETYVASDRGVAVLRGGAWQDVSAGLSGLLGGAPTFAQQGLAI